MVMKRLENLKLEHLFLIELFYSRMNLFRIGRGIRSALIEWQGLNGFTVQVKWFSFWQIDVYRLKKSFEVVAVKLKRQYFSTVLHNEYLFFSFFDCF